MTPSHVPVPVHAPDHPAKTEPAAGVSLVFWGWVWGPVGALLSVPLTVVTKIVLENIPDLNWVAVLLNKLPPQAREVTAETR